MTSTSKMTSFTTTGMGTQTLDEDFELASEYPVVFGVTLTPVVSGIACALVGVAAAAYILINMVLPVQEANSKLEGDIQQKKAQLDQLKKGEIAEKIIQLELQQKKEKSTFLEVLGLFANQKTLDTLLIDVNQLVKAEQSSLVSFVPDSGGITPIDDGSFGSNLDGKIRVQGIDLVLEGDFEQSQTVLQNIERLQPLLIVKNLNTEITERPKYVFDKYSNSIQIEGKPKIKTTFRISAVLPPPEEEIPKLLEPPKPEEPPKTEEKQEKK